MIRPSLRSFADMYLNHYQRGEAYGDLLKRIHKLPEDAVNVVEYEADNLVDYGTTRWIEYDVVITATNEEGQIEVKTQHHKLVLK